MYYGNNANGYGYSPDRSYDVNRFNISTRGNYPTTYNTKGYGVSTPTPKANGGHYDGRGQWVSD